MEIKLQINVVIPENLSSAIVALKEKTKGIEPHQVESGLLGSVTLDYESLMERVHQFLVKD